MKHKYQNIKSSCFRFLILFQLIFVFSDFAKSQSLNDTIEINEIQITAKTNISEKCLKITKIDTLILSTNINKNLSELISENSTLFIKNYGKSSISTVSFRGTAASHTQVLWNGISINSPTAGQFDFSQIPVFLIDEINILYGSSSLSQSSGAFGGSVMLENNPDWTDNFKLKVINSFGSFNTITSFTDFSAGNNKIQSRTRLYFDKSENDFKFRNTAIPSEEIQNQENAQYQNFGIFQELYYRINSKTTISANLWKQLTDRNIPHIMSFTGFHRTENQKDENQKIYFEIKNTGEKLKLKFNTSFAENKLNYYLGDSIFVYGRNNFFIEKSNSQSSTNSFYNNLFAEYTFNDGFKLKTKLFFNHISILSEEISAKRNYVEVSRNETGFNSGIFKSINDKFSAYFILNSILSDKTYIPLIPLAGVNYEPFPEHNLALKFNISKNYRIPSLNDLYWQPGGNLNLKPENGFSADFSVLSVETFRKQTFSFEADIYSSLIKDWIIWQPTEFQYWTAQNLQKVFSYGAEFNSKISGKISKIDYQLFANYAFTSTKNVIGNKLFSAENKQLIYIPKHLFNIHFNTFYKNTSLRLSLTYTGKRTTNMSADNFYTLKSYSLLNISFSKVFDLEKIDINLGISVNNMLNTQYQSILYRAMPGRNYLFTVQFSI